MNTLEWYTRLKVLKGQIRQNNMLVEVDWQQMDEKGEKAQGTSIVTHRMYNVQISASHALALVCHYMTNVSQNGSMVQCRVAYPWLLRHACLGCNSPCLCLNPLTSICLLLRLQLSLAGLCFVLQSLWACRQRSATLPNNTDTAEFLYC